MLWRNKKMILLIFLLASDKFQPSLAFVPLSVMDRRRGSIVHHNKQKHLLHSSAAAPGNRTSAATATAMTSTTSSSHDTTTASTTGAPRPYADLYEFNVHLNRLAEQVSDSSSNENDNLHVIARATACEREWKDFPGGGDVVSLNTVLKAWGRCAQVLADNHEQHTNPTGSLSTMKAVAVAESGLPPVYTSHDAAHRALEILNQHEKHQDSEEEGEEEGSETEHNKMRPDVTSYNIVMDALAKSRSPLAPKEVQVLMDRLLSGEKDSQSSRRLHPDVLSWSSLIDAFAYSNDDDRLQKIQLIRKRMQRLYQHDPETNPHPNTIRIVNSILHAYAHRGPSSSGGRIGNDRNARQKQLEARQENALECLTILKEAKETFDETQDPKYQPDSLTYSTVLHALSLAASLTYTEQAQALFDELQSLHKSTKDSKFQPTVNTYTALILAWARTPAYQSAHRAWGLLNELIEKAESGEYKIRPNAKCFTAAIQAWARSKHVQKAARSLQLLQRMKGLAHKYPTAPTLVAYHATLNACARTHEGNVEQQMAALKIAFAVFKSIERDGIQPNHVIYATLLKATASLMSQGDERNAIAKAVFEKAVAAGQVDVNVIKALQKASDSTVQHELLKPMTDQHGCILYQSVPTSWSKNVRI